MGAGKAGQMNGHGRVYYATTGCPPTAEWQKTSNHLGHSSCDSQSLKMPEQAQFYLATVALKPLAFSMLILADSKASPIPQSVGARGMGITSSSESLMTIKVGSPTATSSKS